MKTTTARFALALSLAAMTAFPILAQRGDDANRRSKNGRAEGTAGGARLTVEYGRPSVNGRDNWGALVPYGKVWRTGADEATTVAVDRDVLVEGQRLPAGTCSLFTIPGEKSWTVIFNKAAQQWGAFDYDAGEDALRVEVAPRAHDHVEAFEIAIEGDTIVRRWAELEIPVRLAAAG
ncbi:MAG TPA: DUF2911 domain-containing protein [Thermoanaerobaculia bacterium]